MTPRRFEALMYIVGGILSILAGIVGLIVCIPAFTWQEWRDGPGPFLMHAFALSGVILGWIWVAIGGGLWLVERK